MAPLNSSATAGSNTRAHERGKSVPTTAVSTARPVVPHWYGRLYSASGSYTRSENDADTLAAFGMASLLSCWMFPAAIMMPTM